MGWHVGGYMCGVFAAFAGLAFLATRGLMPQAWALVGAEAYLILFPVLTLACGGMGCFLLNAENQEEVRDAVAAGMLRRLEAFGAGVAAAVVSLGLCYVVIRTAGLWSGSELVALVAVPVILLLAPAASTVWLTTRARSRGYQPRGFPVLPHSIEKSDD